MVHIQLVADQASLEQAKGRALLEDDAGVLSHILFEMPVVFEIDNTPILEAPRLPIIFMAYDSLERLRNLPAKRRDRIMLPGGGSLTFTMEGDQVIVSFPQRSRTGRTAYAELLRVWEEFSTQVKTLLVERFPELRNHPRLGAWFRGEEVI
jgi:exoribonuclease R